MIYPDQFSGNNNYLDSGSFGCSEINDRVINSLYKLFEVTDWRWIILDGIIDREYNGFPVISLFKVLVLPYLINFSSDRALCKLLETNRKIQALCGFSPNDLPHRGTFWHFRNKYKRIFPELLFRVLVSMVLSGNSPEMELPFVQKITEFDLIPDSKKVEMRIDYYRPEIIVYMKNDLNRSIEDSNHEADFLVWKKPWDEKFRNCRDLNDYRQLLIQYKAEIANRHHQSLGVINELVLPIDVTTKFYDNRQIYFRLVSPSWFNRTRNIRLIKQSIDQPYNKACNVLVMQNNNNIIEILLTKRKSKGQGQGYYSLPGGKQNSGESLADCAARELFEETNLRLLESRPVSIYVKENPGKHFDTVISIGVCAIDWAGEIKTMEPDRHEGWKWYPLENLPTPIFAPTQIAIDQYLRKSIQTLVGMIWKK